MTLSKCCDAPVKKADCGCYYVCSKCGARMAHRTIYEKELTSKLVDK